jgi:hypothetical protein
VQSGAGGVLSSMKQRLIDDLSRGR